MRRIASWNAGIAVCALSLLGAAHAQQGLTTPRGEDVWPRWQARVSIHLNTPLPRPEWSTSRPDGLQTPALALMGDYYFARTAGGDSTERPDRLGGFRATGGLVMSTARANPYLSNARARPDAGGLDGRHAALPYVGLGYTTLSSRGGWRVSADVGLVSQRPESGLRLTTPGGSHQALDDVLRDMRITPLLQVGASYAF